MVSSDTVVGWGTLRFVGLLGLEFGFEAVLGFVLALDFVLILDLVLALLR